MSLNRNEKAAVVTDVAAQVARSQTLALAEYRGMTVDHMNALRKQARERGVYLHVLKNSLAQRAVAGTPFEVAAASMVGPLIYGFSKDAVAAAKVMSDFAKTNGLYARCEPGDALFVPKKTWHCVVALEPSISLAVFGLTLPEILIGGGSAEARNLLHKLHLYRWGNCTCHKVAA